MAAVAATVPAIEQREELDDPLATPDVDKYIAHLFLLTQIDLVEFNFKLEKNLFFLYILNIKAH